MLTMSLNHHAARRPRSATQMLAASVSEIEIVLAKFIASTILFAAHAALVSLASSCSAVRRSVLAEGVGACRWELFGPSAAEPGAEPARLYRQAGQDRDAGVGG
jgi:hypothetical protein